MAFAIVFLMYACSLQPLLAIQEDNKPCVFPFIYGNESYYLCIRRGTIGWQPWCATTDNYDKDQRWKWCITQEHGGNSNGQPCQIPFIYMTKTYYTCTTKHAQKPWCATTGNYDIDGKWSYCADSRLHGDPCVFPFKYNNISHTTCIADDSPKGKPWCSQTKDYDKDLKRVPCEASEGSCVFPFLYKKKTYCSCTSDGAIDGQRWCATTSDYDKHRKWRTCIFKENPDNKTCVFPFIYKEDTYNNCTRVDEPSGRLWCATTPSYDKDAEWTFCTDPETNHNKTCMFPFTYNGTVYTACTKVGSFWRRPWCSLTSNYDVDRKWEYCDISDREKGCSQHQQS